MLSPAHRKWQAEISILGVQECQLTEARPWNLNSVFVPLPIGVFSWPIKINLSKQITLHAFWHSGRVNVGSTIRKLLKVKDDGILEVRWKMDRSGEINIYLRGNSMFYWIWRTRERRSRWGLSRCPIEGKYIASKLRKWRNCSETEDMPEFANNVEEVLERWFSRCGPWNSSISITWALVRIVNYQVLP